MDIMRIYLPVLVLAAVACAQDKVDLSAVQRIRTEAFDNSKVMDTLWRLTDVYGPRLTGSPEIREAAEAKGNRIICECLPALGWTEAELAERPKGDPGKVNLARRLRAETTLTLGWTAGRLAMGRPGYLSHLLYLDRRPANKGKR